MKFNKNTPFIAECLDEKSFQKISSISFNNHLIYIVKNNGECVVTNGKNETIDTSCLINKYSISEFESLSLQYTTKFNNILNKKYITKVACTAQTSLFSYTFRNDIFLWR